MKRFLALFLLVASLAFTHDELAEQVQAITLKIRQEPKRADLYFQRGELYRADGHWKQAELDYLRARKLAPNVAAADLGLGLVYLSTNKLNESKNAFDRFLQQYPENAEARVARGHVFRKLNQPMLAVDDYSKALAQRPDPEIYIERAKLLAEQNMLQDALKGLNDGIERLGPVVTLELYAIDLELLLKHYEEALQRIDRIAEQSERKETWLARKGDILFLASRTEEARESYLLALEAIQGLPQSRKNNRYTRELEAKIRHALENL
ncbi:tetratricopeptide repeat protein [bacterium]|nr:tetratricopeptide repeat protein [bacterium]MCI0602574.1 tetratricopeptide repeat protein [bacterium]